MHVVRSHYMVLLMHNLSRTVADRIRERIQSQGMTRHALATTAGLHYTTLNAKLAGQTDFKLGEVANLAAALHVEPIDLMRDAA